MPAVTIKGKTFNYSVRKKPIGSLNLHLLSPKSFYVSCHRLTPHFVINSFIEKNQGWIYINSTKFFAYPKLRDLRQCSILGQIYQLTFYPSPKNTLIINTAKQLINIYSNNLSQKNLKQLFEKQGRLIAKKLIQNQINEIVFSYKCHINKISVRNQKTRFGSCGNRGNLSFNWQIIFLPPDKFRHVICHELTHLKIKNHQKPFYQALALLDPGWRNNNKWLKTEAKKYFIVKP